MTSGCTPEGRLEGKSEPSLEVRARLPSSLYGLCGGRRDGSGGGGNEQGGGLDGRAMIVTTFSVRDKASGSLAGGISRVLTRWPSVGGNLVITGTASSRQIDARSLVITALR